ncbi:NitT/TauT family transport system permease protein [Streptohalobacillus salinus]|uniref:NitT/TauT family transport system permease protein n=1 Tax=Streptohalobacillus salinus TaxID=621096 RepID=A0A2V3W4L8_9BACI|nr:ABC transporter permease [Streptohalobacillus salinus]PXW87195.1 NitT/TauT family transport system permease protein [Streptohalobacillus salinus]
MNEKLKMVIFHPVLTGFLMTMMVWYLGYVLMDTRSIPAPWQAIIYLVEASDVMVIHLGASFLRVAVALGIALMIGVPIGILTGVSSRFNRWFSPFLYYIYPIPKVAFLPVLMLLYGLGNQSKIILMVLIIVFQIILSVRDGVRQIAATQFTVMASFKASKLATLRFLIIPAILPQLFSGIRVSIGVSLATLFFAENYATTYGIGYFILSAWTKMNYVEMFSGILALSFLGILMFKTLDVTERKLTPWQTPATS